MDPPLLGLIVNENARAVRRRYRQAAFWRRLLPDRLVVCTSSVDDLPAALIDLQRHGATVVAALGGDGTHHQVVDALLREANPPAFLPLAGGTLNGIAKSIGGAGGAERVLGRALARIQSGRAQYRAQYVLRITGATTRPTLHGFGFAGGAPMRVAEAYYAAPDPGLRDAVRAMIVLPLRAALFGGSLFDGPAVCVTVPEPHWTLTEAHTFVASVLDDPLLWFRPFGKPLAGRAAFHCAATNMHPRELGRRLWSISRGRCRHPQLQITECTEVRLSGLSAFILDGDVYACAAGALQITLGPPIRLLR